MSTTPQPAIQMSFTWDPLMGWIYDHNVSQDAPGWATVNTLAVDVACKLDDRLGAPSRIWEYDGISDIIRRVAAGIDAEGHTPKSFLARIEEEHGRQPFDDQDVYRYMEKLRRLYEVIPEAPA